mmetsp:Transcript_3544/g.11034  ORF Transcript_3544/g.11034 Transcript_3544/m.11034 type:complete len:206 (-) Transcript_3544:394-1011(-)
MPRDQMSARCPYCCRSHTSGARWVGVPQKVLATSTVAERPKSPTFTRPDVQRRTLLALTSRCIMRMRCRWYSAKSSCKKMILAVSSPKYCPRLRMREISWWRSPASQNSRKSSAWPLMRYLSSRRVQPKWSLIASRLSISARTRSKLVRSTSLSWLATPVATVAGLDGVDLCCAGGASPAAACSERILTTIFSSSAVRFTTHVSP